MRAGKQQRHVVASPHPTLQNSKTTNCGRRRDAGAGRQGGTPRGRGGAHHCHRPGARGRRRREARALCSQLPLWQPFRPGHARYRWGCAHRPGAARIPWLIAQQPQGAAAPFELCHLVAHRLTRPAVKSNLNLSLLRAARPAPVCLVSSIATPLFRASLRLEGSLRPRIRKRDPPLSHPTVKCTESLVTSAPSSPDRPCECQLQLGADHASPRPGHGRLAGR